jgi:hypothetical protein
MGRGAIGWVLGVAAAASLLLGCDSERCREVMTDGERYCVFPAPVVIEGGIVCPPELPYELRFERGIVCTASEVAPEDLPPEICAMLGGCDPPSPPEPDAGVSDAALVDAGPPGGTWRALPSAPHERVGVCASRSGQLAYYGGRDGTPSTNVITGDGAFLDLEAGTWTVMPQVGSPGRRDGAVVVGTDTGWFVFSGDAGGGALAGGAFLDDGTSTWRPLPTADAPSPRVFAVSAWTGREVLLWGGAPGATPAALGDGAAFDPLAFAWRPIASTAAPSARSDAASAWTGTELVVWGGSDRGFVLGDGAVYDPATDIWHPIAEAGAPSARRSAFCGWDGTRVIVWGGWSSTARLRHGAAYDPLRNSWRGIPSVPSTLVPFESVDLVAGLVGSILVVWGARDSTLGANAGALFDTRTWSWRPVSLADAPTPRSGACGISTDRGFAVILGATRERYLSDGSVLEVAR